MAGYGVCPRAECYGPHGDGAQGNGDEEGATQVVRAPRERRLRQRSQRDE